MIRHHVSRERGEDVWMAGGEQGLIALHLIEGRPWAIVAHSPREMPGWTRLDSCSRMEGLPCWSVDGLSGWDLAEELLLSGITADEDLWRVLDRCYRLYLEGTRQAL